MTNLTTELPLSTIDREFNEFKLRGDDFFRIELLRQAKSWYQKALLLNPGAREVKNLIDECDRQLKYETKVVWILLGIAATAIIAYLLIF